MTLFLRLLQIAWRSLFRPKITDLGTEIRETFRVAPWDLDLFLHLNNAKYLNYMEATRWSLVFRAGFFFRSFKRGWSLPIAKIEIRYLRPLQLWQKFEVTSQIVAYDAKWVYLHQCFIRNGKTMAQAMVRSLVYSKTGAVPPEVYLEGLGLSAGEVQMPPSLQKWYDGFSAS